MTLPGIGIFGTDSTVKCVIPMLKYCGFRIEVLWGRTCDEAKFCSHKLGVSRFTDQIDQLLLCKDVDLVFILCPPHLQATIALKALGIGKHVVCGTPSGPTQLDALKMVNASHYYPSLMSLMCNGFRFLPCFIKMRQLILNGYVGEANICQVNVCTGRILKNGYDWQCDEIMGGGVLNMYGSIVIDILRFVINQSAVRVNGMLKSFTKCTEKINGIRQITSDDFCSFQMEMNKGCCAVVVISNQMPGQFSQELHLSGSKGRLCVRGADLYGQKNGCTKEELLYSEDSTVDVVYSKTCDQINSDIPVPFLKGFSKLISKLKESFQLIDEKHQWSQEPVKFAANFNDNQYVMSVVDAIRQSNLTKEWVRLQRLTEEPDPSPGLSAAVRNTVFNI